jgi:hypothetical protein
MEELQGVNIDYLVTMCCEAEVCVYVVRGVSRRVRTISDMPRCGCLRAVRACQQRGSAGGVEIGRRRFRRAARE